MQCAWTKGLITYSIPPNRLSTPSHLSSLAALPLHLSSHLFLHIGDSVCWPLNSHSYAAVIIYEIYLAYLLIFYCFVLVSRSTSSKGPTLATLLYYKITCIVVTMLP